MSNCLGCGASINCPGGEAFPYSLTPGSPFPYVVNCPEGVDCSEALSITMVCCETPTTLNIPAGTPANERAALIQQLIAQCAFINEGCDGGGTGPGGPDDPNNPEPPPTTFYFSNAQRATSTCANGGTYTYVVEAGRFIASTQKLADQLALNFANQKVSSQKFCLNPPLLAMCVGTATTLNINTVGGTGPFSYSISGSLPVGMSLTVVGGVLRVSGTPTTAGNSTVTLTVYDSVGGNLVKSLTFYAIKITTTSPLPDFTTGEPYSEQIEVAGGIGPFLFSILDGSGELPEGLMMSESGLISGTPTSDADTTFTVVAVDTGLTGHQGCRKEFDLNAAPVTYALGPGMVPAYSVDSDIVLGSFAEYPASGTGPIMTRRTPEMSPSEILMSVNGGAAWYEAGDKFYHGSLQGVGTLGLVVVIDPILSTVSYINVPGADGKSGRRAFFHPTLSEIWVAVDSGNCFLRIDPTNDSIIGYIAGGTPLYFDYCPSDDCVYFSTGSAIFKIDNAAVVTSVFTVADFAVIFGGPTPGAGFGSVAYVTSLDRILFLIYYPGGAYFAAWKITPTTGATTFHKTGFGGSYMCYTPEFDRVIIQNTSNSTPSGLPGLLVAWTVDLTTSFKVLNPILAGAASDQLTAETGCYCDSVSKLTLPVLTGPAGGRYYDLVFYGAGDLT